MKLTGLGASSGIALGRALIIEHHSIKIEKKNINDIDFELHRLDEAIAISKKELQAICEVAREKLGNEKAEIFEAHIMLLEDPELIDQTKDKIKSESVNADWAFDQVSKIFIEMFENLEDEYLRERASDIKDISSRVIDKMFGIKHFDLALLTEDVILIAKDLTPSQTATMRKEKVLGFLTDIGGRTSHSAIMARTMEIPAIVGLKNITSRVKNNEMILFDGDSGEVYINPSEETISELKLKKEKLQKEKEKLKTLVGLPSITKDGKKVALAGNIGSPNDVDSLIRNDAEEIGLYRTEFVFMDRDTMPSEDEQFEYYSKVLKNFKGNCIIRTLDIGGDKQLPFLHINPEMNPFLGYRAIRICLDDINLFKTQLRALLRASVFGNLSIMFPMISSLEEFKAAKNIFEETKNELKAKNISYSNNVKLGVMIEIPSAALISDVLANYADFFSIGTNDLTQYTCAVDRMNEKIAHLYNPYSPGLLRLINMVIKNGNAKNKMVGICGSMSHQKELVPLFLGMGLYEFSMSPMHILPTRNIIRNLNYSECVKLAESVLELETAVEIQDKLEDFYRKHFN